MLGVLGPNGAGKTTAVRVLATLLRPDAGRAEVSGLDVVRDAAKVRERIGLTGQYASVDEDLTAMENLVLIGRLLDLRKAEARARAAELLERFELTEDAGRRVSAYSGGMRRRLDLAASMIGHPDVIFLDEPTTGLDPGRREEAWRLIRSMTRDGGTVLLTTQYLEEADALADEITVIDRGRGHRVRHARRAEADRRRPDDRRAAARPGTAHRGRRDPERGVRARRRGPRAGTWSACPSAGTGGAFAEVVRRLEAAGIGVSELSLRLPSLDEVFFTLTGHGTAGGGGGVSDIVLEAGAGVREAAGRRRFRLARHSLLLAGRSLTKTRRNPGSLGDAVFVPIVFLLLFVYLFGGAVAGSTREYLQYVFPGVLVMTMLLVGCCPPASASTPTSRRACSTGSAACRSDGPRRSPASSWAT